MRPIRSFVIRGGRLTAGQQRAHDAFWPQFGLELSDSPPDFDAVFGRAAPLVLEIGFGMGQSLLAMAAAEPDKNFIGVEVHLPGVGSLLKGIGELGLSNLRVYRDDAVQVLAQCIAPASLQRVQIYFPDPWHKKKHNKRRLVNPEFVAALTGRLAPGGELHLATDWAHYVEQMLEVCETQAGLNNLTGKGQYAPRPDFRPLTKFEKRGERLGHGVWDLRYIKEPC